MNNRNDNELRAKALKDFAAASNSDVSTLKRSQYMSVIRILGLISELVDEDYELLLKCCAKFCKTDEKLVSDKSDLSIVYREYNDIIMILDRTIRKAKNDNNKAKLADCYDELGCWLKDPDLSAQLHQKAIDLYETIKTDESCVQLARMYYNLGIACVDASNDQDAKFNPDQAKKAFEKSIYYYCLSPATPEVFLDMACTFEALKKHDRVREKEYLDSIIYLLSSITENKRDDRYHRVLSGALSHKGDLLSDYQESSDTYYAAIAENNKIIKLTNQDYRRLAGIYHNLACDYDTAKAPVSAQVYLEKAIETLEKVNPQHEKDKVEMTAFLKFQADLKANAAKVAEMQDKPQPAAWLTGQYSNRLTIYGKPAASVIGSYLNHSTMYGKPAAVSKNHDNANQNKPMQFRRF